MTRHTLEKKLLKAIRGLRITGSNRTQGNVTNRLTQPELAELLAEYVEAHYKPQTTKDHDSHRQPPAH